VIHYLQAHCGRDYKAPQNGKSDPNQSRVPKNIPKRLLFIECVCLFIHLCAPQDSGNFAEESAFCGMLNVPDNFPLYETSSVVFFLLPMVILVVLYTRMGLLITRRQGLGESHRTNKSRKSILRMLGECGEKRLRRFVFARFKARGSNEYVTCHCSCGRDIVFRVLGAVPSAASALCLPE
jgi:hypothetical protein